MKALEKNLPLEILVFLYFIQSCTKIFSACFVLGHSHPRRPVPTFACPTICLWVSKDGTLCKVKGFYAETLKLSGNEDNGAVPHNV